MSIRVWAAYALTEFLLSLVPGPAVLFVASQGTQNGARHGALGAAGVVAGNSAYFALSALGLGAVLLASASVFNVMRFIGVAYLAFLGVRLIFAKQGTACDTRAPSGNAFVRGAITQLANPKAILFFTVVLPPFVSPGHGAALQFAVLGVTSIVVEFPVLVVYAWLGSRLRHLVTGRHAWWRDRAAGALLVGTGARLAFLRAV